MGINIERQCPFCGKIYFADTTRLKWGRETTCSRECSYGLRSHNLHKSKQLVCPICGTVFERSPAQIERAKYINVCSLGCLYKGRSLGIIRRKVNKPYKTQGRTIEARKCQACDKEFTCTPSSSQKYCSRKCFELVHSQCMTGVGNPSYIDGSSFDKECFRGSNWAIIRRQVYKRDNYICQICGVKSIRKSMATKETGSLVIQCHHIKPYESSADNNLDNLITLCLACHSKLHNSMGKGSPV